MKNNNGNKSELNNAPGKGAGVSGQQPGPIEGPVAGGADNTQAKM